MNSLPFLARLIAANILVKQNKALIAENATDTLSAHAGNACRFGWDFTAAVIGGEVIDV